TARPPPTSTPFPYTTLFRSLRGVEEAFEGHVVGLDEHVGREVGTREQLERAVETVVVVDERAGDHELVQQDAVVVEPRRVDSGRSEEHTSELQSRFELVCRL